MNESLQYTFRPGSDYQSPLAFLVHGRAGNVSVMSTFSRILPEEWALVFIQAPIPDPIGGYSWWDIQDSLNKDAQRQSSLETLTIFMTDFASANQLAPRFSVAVGFSQGAAMISMLIQQTTPTFKSIALLSGFILMRPSVNTDRKPSVLVVHGTLDEIIPLSRVSEGIELLERAGYSVTLHTEAVGHKVGIQGMRVLKDWAKSL